jgi:hypothetical protein
LTAFSLNESGKHSWCDLRLSPGAEKAGEDLYTTYVPNGTTDNIIIVIIITIIDSFLKEIIGYVTGIETK